MSRNKANSPGRASVAEEGKALVEHAPAFSARAAERVAAEQFGVAGRAEPLASERDQNFLITSRDGQRHVLKIANAAEQQEVLDFQNQALAHVAGRLAGRETPRLAKTRDGAWMAKAKGADGREHFVRLVGWIPGVAAAAFRPHRRELLQDWGAAVAELDRALADFKHPAMRREFHWDLQRALGLRSMLGEIRDPARRALVERALQRFEREALPALAGRPAQVIHNDANDANLLLDSHSGRVTGIIDFGDMVQAPVVCDAAVAATYALLGKPDPVAAAAAVVRGFHSVLPLQEREVELLGELIAARLCLSVTLSAYQSARAPQNDYLRVSEQQAWAALEQWTALPANWPLYAFRDACGMAPSPQASRVPAWLGQNAASFAAVVAPDPRSARVRVFDFSAASEELAAGVDATKEAALIQSVFAAMEAEGAELGVGRYDEARLCYRADQFEQAGNDGPERRTIHLGIDLFARPGTPVFAPLAGRVHSFADNRRPLDYGPVIILQHDAGGTPFFTLYGHLSRESLAGLREGAAVERGQQIGAIGETAVNGGWAPHLHFQLMLDMLGRRGDFPGVAAPSQRSLWRGICPDPNLILRIPEEKFPAPAVTAKQILQQRRQHLSPSLSLSYQSPLHIVRGYRQHLYDAEGRAFLDAYNNVPHVGHSHPKVVQALHRQARLLNTNTRYLYAQLTGYVENLLATFPEPLRVCFLVNSGSEANELALRLARAHTGRRGVLVLDQAYHGNTTTLVEVSPYKFAGPGGEGCRPYVRVIPTPDSYRGPHTAADSQAGAKYAAAVAEAIARAEAEAAERDRPGAFLHESMMGSAGQIIFPTGFLREAYRHARAAGAVCIADEVQLGLGRIGTHFWAFAAQGVAPDIVTLGKPIGNGHPMGAVVTTRQIAESFATGMEYFNTFGGNPVSCAVGQAVLDVMREERLQENALSVGGRLLAGLRELQRKHALISDVRGSGLFIGVELVDDRATRTRATPQAAYVAERMRERGILLGTEGPKGAANVLKIRPPMVFTAADADRLVATLDEILGETPAQRRRP